METVTRKVQLSSATSEILGILSVHGDKCVNRNSFNSLNVQATQNKYL